MPKPKPGVEKYRNPDPRCKYPFEPKFAGYCWGYANHVDGEPGFEKFTCEGCDMWQDKPKKSKKT